MGDLDALTATPTLLMWNKNDHVVSYEGCCSRTKCCCDIGEQRDACVSAASIFQAWSRANQCNGEPENAADADGSCVVGKDCAKPTQFCTYEGDKHSHAAWSSLPIFYVDKVVGFFV